MAPMTEQAGRPDPRPDTVAPTPAPPATPPGPVASAPAASFGRVDTDGTVYVRTANGERVVGQIPDTPAEAALAFSTRRDVALEVPAELLEKRFRAGSISPDEADPQIKKERRAIAQTSALGHLDGLLARVSQLAPTLDEKREVRRSKKAEDLAKAR